MSGRGFAVAVLTFAPAASLAGAQSGEQPNHLMDSWSGFKSRMRDCCWFENPSTRETCFGGALTALESDLGRLPRSETPNDCWKDFQSRLNEREDGGDKCPDGAPGSDQEFLDARNDGADAVLNWCLAVKLRGLSEGVRPVWPAPNPPGRLGEPYTLRVTVAPAVDSITFWAAQPGDGTDVPDALYLGEGAQTRLARREARGASGWDVVWELTVDPGQWPVFPSGHAIIIARAEIAGELVAASSRRIPAEIDPDDVDRDGDVDMADVHEAIRLGMPPARVAQIAGRVR